MSDTEVNKPGITKTVTDTGKSVVGAVTDHPAHAVVGAIVGQVLIPIPFLGAAVGAVIGGWIGKKNNPT